MIDRENLKTYIHKAEAELRENILPFWMRHAVDREGWGFHGEISNDLVIKPQAERGALLAARILWTYAAAFRRYGDEAYLDMARLAYDTLLQRFWDPVYGGFYWAVTAAGEPLRTRKQMYGQAFGIYALAEYHAATGRPEPLEYAVALFRLFETYAYDPVHQGYYEAFSREWQAVDDLRLSDVDLNEMKSMNTHLHVMEAYTNLLRVWNTEEMRQKHAELLDVMMTRIIDPDTYHTILFFDEAWNPRSDGVSFGHDIETSWLMVEAAEVLGDPERLEAAERLALPMAQAVYDEGRDPDGAIVYEAGPHGITHSEKEWWPQAEAAVGFLNAYQISGQPHFLEAALKSWDFIEQYLVDRTHGEWFRNVSRDLQVGKDQAKVSFWKCPYHNGRACLELSARLRSLLD